MNKKNYLFLIVAILAVIGLLIAGIYVYRQSDSRNQAENSENLIGGQKDTHGCLIAAGYSWCEAKQKCLRTWEEPCVLEPAESDTEAIKRAFMDKYGKRAEEVQVEISQFDGNFARGGVKFVMDSEFGAGGIFLAYKEDGVWMLAFDGNGSIGCEEMAGYGFPADMIQDCAKEEAAETPDNAGIANPASAFCLEQGGELEIRTDAEGGQYGVCLFGDGGECEEWAFFRGECGRENKE